MDTPPVGRPSSTPPQTTPAAQAPSLLRRIGNAVQRPLTAIGQFFSRPSASQVSDALLSTYSPVDDDQDNDELSEIAENSDQIGIARQDGTSPPSPTGSGRSSSASTISTGSRSPSPAPSDISSMDEDALEAAQKTREENEIKRLSTIANVQMTFTMEVNGEKVAITPEILKQLQPIFEELGKTPEGKDKLSKGFALVINLDKSSGIHVYQNGNEILKDICASFFENHPDLLKNIQQLQQAIEMAKLLNKPQGAVKKTQPSKMALSVEAAPAAPAELANSDYIIRVEANGDCLLDAALVLIKNKDLKQHTALTARKIREEIRNKLKEDISAMNIHRLKRMLQDILEARSFAQEDGKNLTQEAPFSYLLSEDIENICKNPENISKENYKTLVTAYINYITDETNPTPASLGGYAIDYLNETYFPDEPLHIVIKGRETGFTNYTTPPIADPSNAHKRHIPVLLYNGQDHYDAIDSSKEAFWQAYTHI